MIQGTRYTLLALLQSEMQSAKRPQSYPEDPSLRGAGCIRYTEHAFPSIFVAHRTRGFPPVLNKKITRPMSSLLEHRHKIRPLPETTLFFSPQKRGENFLFYCTAGAHATLQGSALERGGCDATFTTLLIDDDRRTPRWTEILQLGQSAMEGSGCASGPHQSWGEQLRWRSRNNASFAALYRKPKRREGRQLPETVGSPELAVPPLKTQLGPHLLVVGVGSRGAGWDAVPL